MINTDLTITLYSSGTTAVIDAADDLQKAEGLMFDSYYPGGLYGACSFFIPRDPASTWQIDHNQRVAIRNGQEIVWEGYIASWTAVRNETTRGLQVECLGAWGTIAMQRGYQRNFVDARITDDVWVWQTGATASEKCTMDRESRMRFTPKGVAWGDTEYASMRYTAPTGETIYKVSYDYDFAEGAQTWKLEFYDDTNGSSTIADSSGTGSGTYTPVVKMAYIAIRFTNTSGGSQTPTEGGAYYGQISNVKVYATTAAATAVALPTDIVNDVIGEITTLNSDTTNVTGAGAGTTVTNFVTANYEYAADILTRAAEIADSASLRWHAYIEHSETAATPDGKPVVFFKQRPVLTDWEYQINVDDGNVLSSAIAYDIRETKNDWVVIYTDLNGRTVVRTSADNASLKNATSIADIGTRTGILQLSESTTTIADAAGIAYLNTYGTRRWVINEPIIIQNYILNKAGMPVPACRIKAGERVRVNNFIDTEALTYTVFILSNVTYDDTTRQATLTVGSMIKPYVPTYHASRSDSFSRLPKTESGEDGDSIPASLWAQRPRMHGKKWKDMNQKQRKAWTDFVRKLRNAGYDLPW